MFKIFSEKAFIISSWFLCFQFSPVFSSSFGHNSDGAKWLIEFIVSKIINTVTVWSSEIDLLLETCDLLHILVDHDHR